MSHYTAPQRDDGIAPSEVVVAVRSKLSAFERTLKQIIAIPFFQPFASACHRIGTQLRLLATIVSNVTRHSQAENLTECLNALLDATNMTHAILAPFIHDEHIPSRTLIAYLRDGGALMHTKLQAAIRIYACLLHELQCLQLEYDLNVKRRMKEEEERMEEEEEQERVRRIEKAAELAEEAAAAAAAEEEEPVPLPTHYSFVLPPPDFQIPQFEVRSNSLTISGASAGEPHAELSSPIQIDVNYFGDSSKSPYAVELAAAQRRAEMNHLLHTYHEFPPVRPIMCQESMRMRGREYQTPASAASHHSHWPRQFCRDLLTPSSSLPSSLTLVSDYIPSLRTQEFYALRNAFQRLTVGYAAGVHLESNQHGPRIIFIYGEPGSGCQEYAKYVLQHLCDPVFPSSSASASTSTSSSTTATAESSTTESPTEAEEYASFHSQPTRPGQTYDATSPPSYTSDYLPYHYAFNRLTQYKYERRSEGVLDVVARKMKNFTASSTSAPNSARTNSTIGMNDPSSPLGDDGSSHVSNYHIVEASFATSNNNNTSSSTTGASSTSNSASTSRFTVPPFEKEKLHSMHRLRVDSETIMKTFLTELSKSSLTINSSYETITDAELYKQYRKEIIDTPSIVLLSNIHKNDEEAIEKMLFPPHEINEPRSIRLQNQAIFIIQSRQPLKQLMKKTLVHSITQCLYPVDQTAMCDFLLKSYERRAVLRLKQYEFLGGAIFSMSSSPSSPFTRLHSPSGSQFSLQPGHALRLSVLCKGSILNARLCLKNIEAGMPIDGYENHEEQFAVQEQADEEEMNEQSHVELQSLRQQLNISPSERAIQKQEREEERKKEKERKKKEQEARQKEKEKKKHSKKKSRFDLNKRTNNTNLHQTSEWLCSSLENRSSPLVSYLAQHYFPSSMRESIGPVVAFVFSLLSEESRSLFVALSYITSSLQTFSWRLIRSLFPLYERTFYDIDYEDYDANKSTSSVEGDNPVWRMNSLEYDLQELMERGLIERVNEFDLGETGIAVAAAANAQRRNHGSMINDQDADDEGEEEKEGPDGTQRRSMRASTSFNPRQVPAGSFTANAPGGNRSPVSPFRFLHQSRFRIHEVLKEFGLAIACSSSATSGGADFARFFGKLMTRQFFTTSIPTTPQTTGVMRGSERFKRTLQLHLINYTSAQIRRFEEQYQAWWHGRQGGEHDDPENDEDESDDNGTAHPSDEEDGTIAPLRARARTKRPSPSPSRVRIHTLSMSSNGSPGNHRLSSQTEREALAQQRNTIKSRLTEMIFQSEAREVDVKRKETERALTIAGDRSYRRTVSFAQRPPRRSTLLLASRGRQETSTLPASSFASLPLPDNKPTELVYKTMNSYGGDVRLEGLQEEVGDADAVDELLAEMNMLPPTSTVLITQPSAAMSDFDEKEASVLASTPPLHTDPSQIPTFPNINSSRISYSSSSTSSGSSGGDVVGGIGGEDDDVDPDANHDVIPFADEDDIEPEALLAAATRGSISQRRASDGDVVVSRHSRAMSSIVQNRTPSSSQTFQELQAVYDAEYQIEEMEIEEYDDELEMSSSNHADDAEASLKRSSTNSFSIPTRPRARRMTEYTSADFPDSDDADDESDEEYEDVAVRASFTQHQLVVGSSTTNVSQLLTELNLRERALRRAERIEAKRREMEEELDERIRELTKADDMIRHVDSSSQGRTRQLFRTLGEHISLNLLASRATSSGGGGTQEQAKLSSLATAVMQTIVPPSRIPPEPTPSSVASSSSSAVPSVDPPLQHRPSFHARTRSRTGTVFSLHSYSTPSYIRQIQLSKLMYQFDLDALGILTSIRYASMASRSNLNALLLLSPQSIYSTRFSSYFLKSIYFRFLELYKPRYSREWMRALWYLGETYKCLGFLHKSRDCMEEIRLIAQRQGPDGCIALIQSQIGVAILHETQLSSGRIQSFGTAIQGAMNDTIVYDTTLQHERPVADSISEGPIESSLAHPSMQLLISSPSTLSESNSLSSIGSSVFGQVLPLPLYPSRFTSQPEHDVRHIHTILDAIIECYERALGTLESNSLILLADHMSSGTASPSITHLGPHAFNRSFLFLFLRLAAMYAYKGAFHNSMSMVRRMCEMKAAEVDYLRVKKIREKNAAAAEALAKANGQQTKPRSASKDNRKATSPSSNFRPMFLSRNELTTHSTNPTTSILPFALPSTTRIFCQGLFIAGVNYYRMNELREALEYFERAKRIVATLIWKRYRKEKMSRPTKRGANASTEPAADGSAKRKATSTSNSLPASFCLEDIESWSLSSSFLSSLATPRHMSDIMTYVRCIYMQSCTYDRMAAVLHASSSSSQPSVATTPRVRERAVTTLTPAKLPPRDIVELMNEAAASRSDAAFYTYSALVLRSRIVDMWHRITSRHTIVTQHEEMWKIVACMSTLDTPDRQKSAD